MIGGLPWWLCLAIVFAGVLIGHFVIPFHDDTPRLVQCRA